MTKRVVVAGAGVAAVEAVLALRHLAGRDFAIDLVAPTHALEHRPASVRAPFGLDAPPPLDLSELGSRYAVNLVRGELARVDVDGRVVHLADGGERSYELLLVTIGARPVPVLPGAHAFRGPVDVPVVERILDELADGRRRELAIAVPAGVSWPLPAYELALMATTDLRMRGADVTVTVVTTEREPLWLFGSDANDALRDMLAAREIRLRTGARPLRVEGQQLHLDAGETLPADAVISLPALEGPRIAGLPADAGGFLPTDAHGYVSRAERVLAAGDATAFPIKQGGLATQQADAAAETIAAELGARLVPKPFAPVLRGLLLTGGVPLYLRAELDLSGGRRAVRARPLQPEGEVSPRALWWPPGKVAGRYLAPYLATARPPVLAEGLLVDLGAAAGRSHPAEHRAALELALLLADEEAAAGDTAQALQALDAAAALSGGILPAAYADRRAALREQLDRDDRPAR